MYIDRNDNSFIYQKIYIVSFTNRTQNRDCVIQKNLIELIIISNMCFKDSSQCDSHINYFIFFLSHTNTRHVNKIVDFLMCFKAYTFFIAINLPLNVIII